MQRDYSENIFINGIIDALNTYIQHNPRKFLRNQ